MCGPCIKKGRNSCEAVRGANNKLMVTCKLCSKCKRLCDGPRPQWARSIFAAMHSGVYALRWCYHILIKTPRMQVDVVRLCTYVLHHHYAHMCVGLDDETRRQLSRIEAMLNAICNRQGIVPDTLPGYDRCRSPSLSSHSPSSIGGASVEKRHPFNLTSEPPRKAGTKCICHSYCMVCLSRVQSQWKWRLV